MLALTPAPLQTAGERALFAELKRWDTGGAIRAGVVASIPVVEDGALQRRLSDAVLVVPEGLAVVRIVEVPRQTGVVTARPEGPWTIAADRGPGEVLQLAGGGSTPLDGLMRSGMDAAVRLRRAGLEPGRIARLTVLVGPLTGLEPPDGDLGEGDQVALLEPRSLLLAIARAARHAGTDNPRLWTTADVRAALESLGLQSRGPSVEELNGEGFAYSPYVLRRPELLAPAGIAAAPDQGTVSPAAGGGAVFPAPVTAAPPAPVPTTPPGVQPPPVPPARGPVSWSRPEPADDPFPTPADSGSFPTQDSGGLGGLFASAESDSSPGTSRGNGPGSSGPLGTAVFPASAGPTMQPGPPGNAGWSAPRLLDRPVSEERSPRRAGRKVLWLVAAGLVVAALVVVGGIALLQRSDRTGTGSQAAATSARPADQLRTGTVQQVDGISFTVQAVRVDKTCVGHAYGAVGQSFATNDCTGLARVLYSAQVNGKPAVLSVSRIRMRDNGSAASLRALADRDGTGNVSDLLREGVRYTGGPDRLADSQYASAVDGSTVTIVESAWVAGPSAGSSAPLDAVASSGLVLATPDPGK